MSIQKTKSTTRSKVVASAALVALSGFVPQPLMNTAHAASASISVSGSFITGIQLTAVQAMDFGSIAVTDTGGKATLNGVAGTVSATSKGVAIGGAAQGSFVFKAVSTVPNVDITVKVPQANGLTLASTAGGAAATGSAKLINVVINGIGAAATTLALAPATSVTATGYNINTTSAALKLGGRVDWPSAVQTIGAFAAPLTLTIGF